MQEGQWMCLVAAPWWAYWSSYAGLTAEDLEQRVPERNALGLTKAAQVNASQLASTAARTMGAASAPKAKVAASTGGLDRQAVVSGDNTVADGVSGYNGLNGHLGKFAGGEETGVRVKDREVPAVLARRPHEMDNSILQVRNMSACGVVWCAFMVAGRFCFCWPESLMKRTACLFSYIVE